MTLCGERRAMAGLGEGGEEAGHSAEGGGRLQVPRAAVVWRGEGALPGGGARRMAMPLDWGYKHWADACLDRVQRDRSREREVMGKTLSNLPFTIKQMAGLNFRTASPRQARRSGGAWRNRYDNALCVPLDADHPPFRSGHASRSAPSLGPALSQAVLQRFGQPYSGVQANRFADVSRPQPQPPLTLFLGPEGKLGRPEVTENSGKVARPRSFAFRSPNDVILQPEKNLAVMGMKMQDGPRQDRQPTRRRQVSRKKPQQCLRPSSPVFLVVPCPSPYNTPSTSLPPTPSSSPEPWSVGEGTESGARLDLLQSGVLAVHRLGEGGRGFLLSTVPTPRCPWSSWPSSLYSGTTSPPQRLPATRTDGAGTVTARLKRLPSYCERPEMQPARRW